MLTALEDKAATKHAPRSPDRDVGSDDDESMHSVDSHGARIGPYTPERGAPPSYEHVMLSPMPTEPPSTPPRLGHHCSYSGEGERGNRVLTLFLGACYTLFRCATRPRTAPATRHADFAAADALCVSATFPSSTGGAEYDSLGFPIPDWLSPRCVPVRNSSRLVGRNDAWNGVSRSARRSKTPKRCVFSRLREAAPDIGPRPGSVLTRSPPFPSDAQIRGDPRHVPRRARETAHRARGVQGASSVLPRARARRNTPIVQSEASNAFQKNPTDVPFHPRSPRKPPLFFVETFRH